MIGAFPDLYPDELLVSGWARYENWVQYGHRRALMEDLFGYDKKMVDFVLPSGLGAFTAALPPGHRAANVDDLMTHHTLLPYYGAFQPAEQQQFLRQQMGGYEAVNLRSPMGLSQSEPQMPRMLRYCPTCAADDRTAFGETYWHHIHQAAGVMVCPKHAVWLEVTEAPMWVTPGKTTFPLAETTVPVSVPRPVNVEIVGERHLLRLAQAVKWLLEHPDISREDIQLQARCRTQLVDRGLASYSKRFKQTEILDVFQETFTPELLAYLSCDWSNRYTTTSWPSRLLHGGHHSPKFVLYMLLLMLFVAEDVPAFLALPIGFAPFGSGPWPCLNPACPHDGQDHIAFCDVYYHKDGIPRGTFTCPTCAFSYRRAGPDTSRDDVYRTNRQHILVRGPLWDAKLREVWIWQLKSVRDMSD